MGNYKSATEHAAEIRAELKKAGITSKMVSVKSSYFSCGSSVDVKIKDAALLSDEFIAKVEGIANPHSHVDYDQITGEVLSGGNMYLTVRTPDGPCCHCGRPAYWHRKRWEDDKASRFICCECETAERNGTLTKAA